MKNKWLQRLFYSVVFLSIALLWGELYVHILLPQNVDNILNIFQPDPIVGYIYQPNAKASESGREYEVSYKTNSLGLRDREYDLNAKDVFRVLLFGDSFSESHGLSLEKSLPKQIEWNLQKELDRKNLHVKAEVVNVSFGGYSPYHYWKSYRRWKSIFKPKLVMVGYYMGNDYICGDENIRYLVENGEIVGRYIEGETPKIPRKNQIKNLRKWLAQNSEFYVLLRNYFYYNDIIGFLTKKADIQESDSQLKPYLNLESDALNIERGKCFGYLKRLREETALDGVPVALIAIPRKFEIDRSYLEQILKIQGISPNKIDIKRPHKILSEFCSKTNIAFFDPGYPLRLHHLKESCYFRYDGHWNAKGVEIAALSIVQQWKKQKLPPFD